MTHAIVSYNITFRPEEYQSVADSYIQVGLIAKGVSDNSTWIDVGGWNMWGLEVSFSYFLIFTDGKK